MAGIFDNQYLQKELMNQSRTFYMEIVTKEAENLELIPLIGYGQSYPATPRFLKTSQNYILIISVAEWELI